MDIGILMKTNVATTLDVDLKRLVKPDNGPSLINFSEALDFGIRFLLAQKKALENKWVNLEDFPDNVLSKRIIQLTTETNRQEHDKSLQERKAV